MKKFMIINKPSRNHINVIGAGLAGCEAAWQIAQQGVYVNLYDMKPYKFTPAHKSQNLSELVCSNSFKSKSLSNASGLLKEELRILNSFVLNCALESQVPAGDALAVDREIFSDLVTKGIKNNKFINYISQEVCNIPTSNDITIICTGPLTSDSLSESIVKHYGKSLNFYDAAAPIVTAESIDMNHAFYASRYGKGSQDYLNCPLNRTEYENFYNALISAEKALLHSFDTVDFKVYEGCMPIEVAALRGFNTLRFGPMKPIGITNPNTNEKPFAIVQLRKENFGATLFNMVGFQTNLKFQEQRRVFSMIPALKNAEFIRYGVMHRNAFINSPKLLNPDYSMRDNKNLFFAGQITGTEGYMESVSSGLVAGINAVRRFNNQDSIYFPNTTMIGALSHYVCDDSIKNFQPMGANFGIIRSLDVHIKDKKLRNLEYSNRSIENLKILVNQMSKVGRVNENNS